MGKAGREVITSEDLIHVRLVSPPWLTQSRRVEKPVLFQRAASQKD